MTRQRSFLFLSLPPFFVFLLDLVLRFSYLRLLEFNLIQHFFLSFLFEWTICFVVIAAVGSLKKKRNEVLAVIVGVLSGVQLLVYGHYLYFGVLPNPYSINYFINHSADSISLIGASVELIHGFLFLLLFTVQYVLFRNAVNGMEHVSVQIRRSLIAVFVAMLVVFNNNVRFAPASYSITPATIYSVKYALQERWFGSSFEVHKGYVRRRFEIAERPVVNPSYNAILFISESVRKRSWSSYGYRRQTTPFLDSLIAAGTVVRFDRSVSNAVSTQYSVPMILSGNFTITKADQPFIYDYIKRRTTAKTYFFTSQSMQRSNIDLVYHTMLDTFVCQETQSLPEFNDLGVDDAEFYHTVSAFHQRRQGERFFSVIQFNNTHYPYTVKPSTDHFAAPDSALVDDYDNTILEQDGLLRSYFYSFRSSGLLDSTVIFFTSDHGEAFGEHGHQGHLNTLYGEEIDVPMFIFLPPGFPAKMKREVVENARRNTSNLDLFPTMMELFGIAPDSTGYEFAGGSLFHPQPAGRYIAVVGKDMIDTKAVIIDSMKYIETKKEGIASYEAYAIHSSENIKNNLWERLPAETQQRVTGLLHKIDAASTRLKN